MNGKILIVWALIGSVVILMLGGCSGVSQVGYPIQKNGNVNEWKHRVLTTISDPHAFTASAPRSRLEICDGTPVKGSDANGFPLLFEYSHCVGETSWLETPTTGYLDGLGKALVYGGAMVGTGALIGDGLSRSGDSINQSGGGATQSQGQAQGIIAPHKR